VTCMARHTQKLYAIPFLGLESGQRTLDQCKIARRNYERESRRAPHCSVLPKDTPRFVVPGSTGATRFPWPRTWASTDPKATGGWGRAYRLESIAATPGSRARAMLCAGRAGSLSLGTRTWQGRARSDAPRTPSRRPTKRLICRNKARGHLVSPGSDLDHHLQRVVVAAAGTQVARV